MPWIATGRADPDHVYLVMATRFTVARRFRLIGVALATRQLWSEIDDVDGLAGYSVSADLARGTLATLTAWRDEASLAEFVRAERHAELVAMTLRRMRASAFARWQTSAAGLPPRWDEAARRLEVARMDEPPRAVRP